MKKIFFYIIPLLFASSIVFAQNEEFSEFQDDTEFTDEFSSDDEFGQNNDEFADFSASYTWVQLQRVYWS